MMDTQYFTDLDARHLAGPWYRLLSPFAGYSARYNFTWCAPPGFVLDFASVPRFPVAYWLFGGRGKWASVPHDLGYRWGVLTRWQWDMIFLDSARAYHDLLKKQGRIRRAGRWFSRTIMTAAVISAGWISFKGVPGCLDFRDCKMNGGGEHCQACAQYYPAWEACIKPGFWPEIAEYHK